MIYQLSTNSAHVFPSQFHGIFGKIYSEFAEKSPYGAITNSEVSASNSLFLCWLAHLVGFNSEPKIFRRYEQVWFTAILGDYFRIFFVSPPEQVLNQAQQKHREEVKELMDEVRWFHRQTIFSGRGLMKGFLWRCWFKNDRDILKPCQEIENRVFNLFCHVLPYQSCPGIAIKLLKFIVVGFLRHWRRRPRR